MTDLNDHGGAPDPNDPIDTEFEPLPKSHQDTPPKRGLGWFGAFLIALIAGGIGAVGGQFLAHTPPFSAFLEAYTPAPIVPVVDIDAQKAEIDALINTRIAEITTSGVLGNYASIDNVQQIQTQLDAARAELETVQQYANAQTASGLEATLTASLAAEDHPIQKRLTDLNAQIDTTATLVADHNGRLGIITELIAPVVSRSSPPPVANPIVQPPTPEPADTEVTAPIPETDALAPSLEAATSTIRPQTPEPTTADQIQPIQTVPQDQGPSALEQVIDLQNRARATLLLAKMGDAITTPDVYEQTRAEITGIDLDSPALAQFLSTSEVMPLSDVKLTGILNDAQTAYLEASAADTPQTQPSWLEGFVTIKRANPKKEADLAHFETLLNLTGAGQIAEAHAHLKGLPADTSTIFSPYGDALSARLDYENALTTAQNAMSSEAE